MGKEKKVKAAGGGFNPPSTKRVLVNSADAKGDQVVCTFTARKTSGGDRKNLIKVADKVTKTFQCDSPEHAKLLAEHALKLHSRISRHGLVYSLTKLADNEALLRKARLRAAKKYAARQKIKEENARARRLQEEHRMQMERKRSAA